ncbi:GFA family protein [Massilia dura]|uniref:GFA family protein n=1 Tax=Pseudoduganella dura TaxID=321982 RepID=A0A6I3XEG6_9BURK|nr:GFA family protein [Pseudoduganella dura]MUI11971.1 GFA family protein [Pseudoduganella dura]GGX84973.1 aldehyde-activating protein [Pseudoduganella dura]
MDSKPEQIQGACHCGSVRFLVRLADGLDTARRCNCSYCSMRGAIAVSAALQDIEITAGAEWLTLYQFNTMQAKHYFCSKCGIYTHHQRRSDPGQYGINAACLEGISPFDFSEVPVNEGRIHPRDNPVRKGSGIAGYLRYFPGMDNEAGSPDSMKVDAPGRPERDVQT